MYRADNAKVNAVCRKPEDGNASAEGDTRSPLGQRSSWNRQVLELIQELLLI
jgi:hypothetical protein